MTAVPPWANSVFELIVHAEMHLLENGDFDRRIALISFDNAIENSITTYLTLNPINRGGKAYPNSDVGRWLTNYHTRLDFLEAEINSRQISWTVDKPNIVWVHDQRNQQFHGGYSVVPEQNVLEIVRCAALWVFSMLFGVSDVQTELKREVRARTPAPPPVPNQSFDKAIDARYGIVNVCGESYYASELLFAVDVVSYRGVGESLVSESTT